MFKTLLDMDVAIRKLRVEEGLSWRAIATRLGVSAATAHARGRQLKLYTGSSRSKDFRPLRKSDLFVPTPEILEKFKAKLKEEIEQAVLEMSCSRVPYKPHIPEWGV